jgi:two-component system OmpR family response regulator
VVAFKAVGTARTWGRLTMRVLYVDDDRINTLLFVETCRFAGGVTVETAATGAEALQLAGSWQPDLLVIDLHLPDTDGYRLLPALRQALGRADLPAILCTADEAQRVAAPARAAGFDGCWTKPVELGTVMAELSRRAAALAAASPSDTPGGDTAR